MTFSQTTALGEAARALDITKREVLDIMRHGALGYRRETATIAGRTVDAVRIPKEDVDRLLDRRR